MHVPRSGGAAFGAQPAMQADVFVFHHHPAGLQAVGDVEGLVEVRRRGALRRVRRSASSPFAVKVMQSNRGCGRARVASMQSCEVNTGLDVAVQACARASPSESLTS